VYLISFAYGFAARQVDGHWIALWLGFFKRIGRVVFRRRFVGGIIYLSTAWRSRSQRRFHPSTGKLKPHLRPTFSQLTESLGVCSIMQPAFEGSTNNLQMGNNQYFEVNNLRNDANKLFININQNQGNIIRSAKSASYYTLPPIPLSKTTMDTPHSTTLNRIQI